MEIFNVSTIMPIVGVLVVIVNIVVQVLKKVTWDKIPTQILAMLVSLALTLITFAAYSQIKALPVEWYHWAAAVVTGFLVSYAAMFGFDKLKEAFMKKE